MLHQHGDILKCLRNKSVAELTKFRFTDNPSFLTAMGPSRDGIIIPADFGLDQGRVPPRRGPTSGGSSFFMKSRKSNLKREQKNLRIYKLIFLKILQK